MLGKRAWEVRMQKAVFLDKDGTIIHDVPYNIDPSKIELTPGCAEALLRLHLAGLQLIVISNQPGLAKGIFSLQDLRKAERFLARRLASFGIPIKTFYYCPHHPGGGVPCACRKPAPGLIEQAAREHDLDLAHSWMIGDILNDIEAGRRAGCRTILINNGNETERVRSSLRTPDHMVPGLAEAADIICNHLAGTVKAIPGRPIKLCK
jgi:histidinol-phosphate phosphatase family protein